MNNIYKSFGANRVLHGVDFTLKGGEICALLGKDESIARIKAGIALLEG
jgi:ABC-type sugar transport system ATPase subunit